MLCIIFFVFFFFTFRGFCVHETLFHFFINLFLGH
ncbi:hypothetical protein OIU76_003698, partial [Salix suchowensis]